MAVQAFVHGRLAPATLPTSASPPPLVAARTSLRSALRRSPGARPSPGQLLPLLAVAAAAARRRALRARRPRSAVLTAAVATVTDAPVDAASETCTYLEAEAGLNAEQMSKVRKFWAISGGHVPPVERCRAVIAFLSSHEVGLSAKQARDAIADAPETLGVYSVETLREKIRFLEQEAGLVNDVLIDTLSAFPKILSRSITETLRPALEFWVGIVGVPREEFGELIKKAKAEVWCKPQTLKPKWKFAKDVMGLNLDTLLACNTPYFRLSLPRVVAPRHFFLIGREPTGKRVALDKLLGYNDKKFATEVAECKPKEYAEWLEKDWPETDAYRTLSWIHPRRPGGDGDGDSGSRGRPKSGRQRYLERQQYLNERVQEKIKNKAARRASKAAAERRRSLSGGNFDDEDGFEQRSWRDQDEFGSFEPRPRGGGKGRGRGARNRDEFGSFERREESGSFARRRNFLDEGRETFEDRDFAGKGRGRDRKNFEPRGRGDDEDGYFY